MLLAGQPRRGEQKKKLNMVSRWYLRQYKKLRRMETLLPLSAALQPKHSNSSRNKNILKQHSLPVCSQRARAFRATARARRSAGKPNLAF